MPLSAFRVARGGPWVVPGVTWTSLWAPGVVSWGHPWVTWALLGVTCGRLRATWTSLGVAWVHMGLERRKSLFFIGFSMFVWSAGSHVGATWGRLRVTWASLGRHLGVTWGSRGRRVGFGRTKVLQVGSKAARRGANKGPWDPQRPSIDPPRGAWDQVKKCRDAPRRHQGGTKEAPGMHRGCTEDAPRMCQVGSWSSAGGPRAA